jgi:hypothetical protein
MPNLFATALRDVDDLLRGERTRPQTLTERGLDVASRRLAIVITLLCMIYGVCMGTFSLAKDVPPTLSDPDGRYWQVLASTVKTPALFFLTLLVTLPSLYVFNALVGSRLRLLSVIRLLVASLAVNAAVLASLGPIVAFFSVSTSSHAFIVLLNVAAFAVAGSLGLMFLLQTLHRLTEAPRRTPRHPAEVASERINELAAEQADASTAPAASVEQVATDPLSVAPDHFEPPPDPSALDMPEGQVLGEHTRTVFRVWVVLFAMVGAQMGWVLRPFIGRPELPFAWFRERKSNFFAAVLNSLGELLFGPGGID